MDKVVKLVGRWSVISRVTTSSVGAKLLENSLCYTESVNHPTHVVIKKLVRLGI